MKKVLVVLAVLLEVCAAGPASAFKLSYDAYEEVSVGDVRSLINARPNGSLHRLWMQPQEYSPGERRFADSFYKLCTWAHGLMYERHQIPANAVRECVDRQINLPENAWVNDPDEIYHDSWYVISLTTQELHNLLDCMSESEQVATKAPLPAPDHPDPIVELTRAVQTLEESVRELEAAHEQSPPKDNASLQPPDVQHEDVLGALRMEIDALEERVTAVEEKQEAAADHEQDVLPSSEQETRRSPESSFDFISKYWWVFAAFLALLAVTFLAFSFLKRKSAGEQSTHGKAADSAVPTSAPPSETEAPSPETKSSKDARPVRVLDKDGKEHVVPFEPTSPSLDGTPRYINPLTGNAVKEDGLIKYAKDYLREKKKINI